MLLVGVLWVLPMLALALLFSEGDGLVETGCRFAPEQGHPEERREERPMRTWRKGKEHLTERERETKKNPYQVDWLQLSLYPVQLGTLKEAE